VYKIFLPLILNNLWRKLMTISKIKNEYIDNKIPSAQYRGELPIGNISLDCAVLDNGMRILSASSIFKAFERPSRGNSRLEIKGIKIPAFMDAKNLEPYINENIINAIQPVAYLDGKQIKYGYVASLLPMVCEVYLAARRSPSGIVSSQAKLAEQSEILLVALAQVGIDALVDEATGFQRDRKHDALRILLSKYINEGLSKWVKTFPTTFFSELDRLYGNEPTSYKRPQYYGKFINKYIYEPLENGYLKEKLNELNITDEGKRIAKFHQWLTSDGRDILIGQIGRVQGRMEDCESIQVFKERAKKIKMISIAPYLFDDMNKIIE
jgi:hypothetical protein